MMNNVRYSLTFYIISGILLVIRGNRAIKKIFIGGKL